MKEYSAQTAVKLAVDPMNADIIYIGYTDKILKYNKEKRHIEHNISLNKEVTNFFLPETTSHHIFITTQNGLYFSSDQGRTLERVFFSSDELENFCLTVFADDQGIYLGTKKGLFFKENFKPLWRLVALKNEFVFDIHKEGSHVFVVTDLAVYAFDEHFKNNRRIFALNVSRVSEDEPQREVIDFHVVDDALSKYVVSTTKGVFYSVENGPWKKLSSASLPKEYLSSTVIDPSLCFEQWPDCLRVFASTSKGVFTYKRGVWFSLYRGMKTNRVNELMIADRQLWAATDKGVFHLDIKEAFPSCLRDGEIRGREVSGRDVRCETLDEPGTQQTQETQWTQSTQQTQPTIKQVHQMAIDYAQVHPEKITQWQMEAKRRAWLPDLSIGLDSDWGRSTSDSIYGSSSSGGSHYIAPDDKSFSRGFGWDVGLSWDLGDLIWSTDQTTIDSRAKLMVELREDILDQVTRLYFERKRLIYEKGSASNSYDMDLRIEELTAYLDGYTGGAYSQQLNKNND